jgi:UDP-GlcNAc:undecaprenyl-phosphate GlcNAc-1-phosphate transferase
MLVTSIFAFIVSLLLLYFFHPKAIQSGFVDKADHRKLHQGNIPLIGGPVIFIAVITTMFIYSHFIFEAFYFVLGSGLLMLLGVVDDKKNLRVSVRLVSIIAVTVFLYYFAQLKIDCLGDLFSMGLVNLDYISLFFTLIAVIGAITAFNMVDGLDGLLGCLSIVTFASLSMLFAINGQLVMTSICIAFIASLLSFLLCNLELLPGNKYKVFMGDSGSFFIGFSIITLLISGSQISSNILSQNSAQAFRPVTALWIIAMPLMDMAANVLRRLKKGQSPFAADRGHIHHILQRIGLSDLQVLAFITFIAVFYALVGIAGELYQVPEWIMLCSFIVVFCVYFYLYLHSWKVSAFIHHLFRKNLTINEELNEQLKN